MKITLNIEKRFAYVVIGVLIVVLGALIVYSYNSGGPASFVGHSSEEIDVNISGTLKTLQQAIDDGDFSGGSSPWSQSGSNIYYNSGNVGIGTASPGQKLAVNGVIDVMNHKITNLAAPTADSDAANKEYVDRSWCKVSDVKVTNAKHDGKFGGYHAMYNWIQSHGCAGYHVCDGHELACWFELRGDYYSPFGWYIMGGGQSVFSDCASWRSHMHDDEGPARIGWAFNKEPCNRNYYVYCCK